MLRALIFLIAVTFSSVSFAAENQDMAAAKLFISAVGDDVVTIFEQNPDAKKREKLLTQLFERSIDSDWMGKFVLGKYWKQASSSQQKKFLGLYKDFLLNNYLPHFRDYSGEKQKVVEVIDEGDGDYLVRTQIVNPSNNKTVHVAYRVHRTPGSPDFHIFDIVTEGVSVVTTHRSDFGAVVAREGIDGLIHRIRAKIYSIKNSS